MMVAVSPVEMRYFATPKSSKHFNPTLCFHWADERVQTVDSAYIIALVGTKVKNRNGVRTIDDESLRIILEKIQKLRNLGEKDQADILHNFLMILPQKKYMLKEMLMKRLPFGVKINVRKRLKYLP